jgi:hypothetical protein
MRPLILDAETKQSVQRVIDFASLPENTYIPANNAQPPGDNPQYVAQLNSFRCVFSITESKGKRFRQLSVSIPSKLFPNAIAVFTIASLFGFTGGTIIEDITTEPCASWQIAIDENAHCIVVAEELKPSN